MKLKPAPPDTCRRTHFYYLSIVAIFQYMLINNWSITIQVTIELIDDICWQFYAQERLQTTQMRRKVHYQLSILGHSAIFCSRQQGCIYIQDIQNCNILQQMDPSLVLHVEDTNEEALSSKISAIRKGYINDPYAEQFAQFKGTRDILMHRGYWARVHLVKRLVEKFLNSSGQLPVQILSLGCGLETLWFNLIESEKYQKRDFKFVEMDLHSVVKKKIKKIEKSHKIKDLMVRVGLHDTHKIQEDHSYLNFGDKYMLRACDLSNLSDFKSDLENLKIDFSKPTLIYFECVLSYIEPEPVDQLLSFIRQNFRLCWVYDYEMFNPLDRFGKMMVQNFDARDCPLVGIHKYPLLEDQRHRFEKAGFEGKNVELDSMDKIYYNYIDKQERMRIEKIEMLDELEEWNILMGHYFSLLAHNCLKADEAHAETELRMIESVKMKHQ